MHIVDARRDAKRRDKGLHGLPAVGVEKIAESLADQLLEVLGDQDGGGRVGLDDR